MLLHIKEESFQIASKDLGGVETRQFLLGLLQKDDSLVQRSHWKNSSQPFLHGPCR